ncbi:MAG: hypothetical protein ACXVB5_14540 [Isosphaeraceae bacterium]
MSADSNGFVGLVARMRTAQKHWYRYNDVKSLQEAKSLEREVDRWLDHATSLKARPTLFDRPEGGQR